MFTNRPGGALANLLRLRFANSAAHDVYGFGGRIYAADVFGHYALEQDTLETTGTSPLNRMIERPNDQIAPMPRLHLAGDRLTAYRFRPGILGCDRITLFELDGRGNVVERREHALEGRGNAVHDVAFCESHDVICRWGTLALGKVALGTATIGESITLPEGDALVYLLPRTPGEKKVVARFPRQQIFHLFNAFRDGDAVVIDTVSYEQGIDFARVHPDRYTEGLDTPPLVRRHRVALGSGAVESRTYDAHGEAPEVDQRRHGQRHRFGYVAGVDRSASSPVVRSAYFWATSILKIDFESGAVSRWEAPAGAWVSPPAFVPSGPGEDEGHLLCWLSRGEESAVVVLAAETLVPTAIAWFPARLPAASHVGWMQG